MKRLHYPNTRKVEQIDDYHGTCVSDPNRWLEDTSSPEVKSWIDEQNLLTQSFLNDIPTKDRIRKRLTALWNYLRALAPKKVNGISYPATLATTADHDDRVVPGHSFKFIAALQSAQAGDSPVLIRVQTKAGHGFGKPTKLLIEEQTDIIAFLVKVLDIKVH